MVCPVADRADQETVPLFTRMALFAEHAVVAEPLVLNLFLLVLELFGVGQAVRVERLSTQIATQEILLISERATQVAHLLKNKRWVLKAHFDGVRVPAVVALIVCSEILHQFLPLLVRWQLAFLDNLAVQVLCRCG